MNKFVGIFLTAILLLIGSSPAFGGTKTLTYANFPPAKTFPCVQMERWKEVVEKRTDGQVKIKTFPGGTLLGAKNMLRGVVQGQADIGCLCMAYQPGVFPLTSVMELPLGFKDAKTASLVLFKLYQKYQPQEFSQVKVLTMFTCAPSNVMSKTPVQNLEDFKGLELRASGIASSILEKIGATPVSMPMSETPEALQKGVVKGLLSSLEVLLDLNFAAYCPEITMTNFQVYPFAVVMNKGKWNSLSQETKEIMDDLALEQARWTGEYMDRHVKKSLNYAKKEYQAQVHYLPQKDVQIINNRIEPLIKDWKDRATEKGLPAEAILNDIKELKDSVQ